MEITEVRVRLLTDPNDRLKAVCTITLDEQFVIRDMKIVEGTHGLFVAMPSRKLSAGCPRCRSQNHLRAKHCNECGTKLPPMPIPTDDNGREKAHRDVAHPITATVREMLQDKVLTAYAAERENAHSDGETAFAGKQEDEFGTGFEAPIATPKASVGPVCGEAAVDVRAPAQADTPDETSFGSGMPAESTDEPAVEPPVLVGEYNSLIADLKGGAKRRGSEDNKPSSDERGPRKRRRRGSRGGGRDDDRKREDAQPREKTAAAHMENTMVESKENRCVQNEPRPQQEPKPAARATEPVAAKPASQPDPASDDACGFGAGLDEPLEQAPIKARETQAEQPRRKSAASVETKEPRCVAEASSKDTETKSNTCPGEETDAGFGAGIL